MADFDFCNVHSYSDADFTFHAEEGFKSKFDLELESSWLERMEKGYFRYGLEEVRTRCIPGKYGFIAQIIFLLSPVHWEKHEASEKKTKDVNALIINISPLEHCNSLLVPSIEMCYSQVLTLNGLRLALETVLISHNPALRLGFNGLGAYASVNHLHFHLYYLQERLYLEHAPVEHLKGKCYELRCFPAEGFVFQLLQTEDVVIIARSIMKLVEFLLTKKIAHNIFITRGRSFNKSVEDKKEFNAVRVYVWARASFFGSKNDLGFNPALCELAGHLPIKEMNYYESITEEDVTTILDEVCHQTFAKVRDEIKTLYEE